MTKQSDRKKELDSLRTQWRKTHRTLNGRIILYPDKPAEHINARGSKLYNWFWGKILCETKPQEIPAIISGLQDAINAEKEPRKIQVLRTMIGMAEDAYQFKQLEDIKDCDTELQLEHKPVLIQKTGSFIGTGTFTRRIIMKMKVKFSFGILKVSSSMFFHLKKKKKTFLNKRFGTMSIRTGIIWRKSKFANI